MPEGGSSETLPLLLHVDPSVAIEVGCAKASRPATSSTNTTRSLPLPLEIERYQSLEEQLVTPWTHALEEHSLPEFHAVVQVPQGDPPPTWWARLCAYVGPGAMIAVGYMDPGNWSTDIAGGSAFGYDLLSVVLMSSFIGMFLQYLALKTGLATGRDLAQICRDSYPPYVVTALWISMEIAICATDIAEVLGSAIALKLLFGLPIFWGVCLTAFDVLLVLFLNTGAFRVMELLVVMLIAVISFCFLGQVIISQPDMWAVMKGLVPQTALVTDSARLFVSIGILGATIMPHNLFLHSSIVLTRNVASHQIKEAISFGTLDSNLSLSLAFLVNAAILIVSAATFHSHSHPEVATLEDAYHLMDPILKSSFASVLFAVALLASGQNSTLTGTLTGQIVMEGFMTWKMHPTLRRLVTRGIAIFPALLATAFYGDDYTNSLLLLSQVVLAFTLPFAVVPLIHISSSKQYMGAHVNSAVTTICAIVVAVVVLGLNCTLIFMPTSTA